ncbi:MAG: hypothetical protein SNH13_05785 [Rikenellaceae bacterium]
MYLINSQHYEALTQRLHDSIIGGSNYFNGNLSFETNDADCDFIASLIIYRSTLSLPEGIVHPVCDIVPVWWEFHTKTLDGEQINDFDFETFKSYVIACL